MTECIFNALAFYFHILISTDSYQTLDSCLEMYMYRAYDFMKTSEQSHTLTLYRRKLQI